MSDLNKALNDQELLEQFAIHAPIGIADAVEVLRHQGIKIAEYTKVIDTLVEMRWDYADRMMNKRKMS